MSDEKQKLDEARRLWDNAVEALDELSSVNEETLRKIAKTRTRMPVIVFGQKGRIGEGITVAEYTKDLGLGSELPVKADLPKGGLRAYILGYIDRVSMLQARDEPKQKTVELDQEEMEHGVGYHLQDQLDAEWLDDLNAFKLPALSKETLKLWAEYITAAIKQDAQLHGGYEIEEIGGKEQCFSTGFSSEIEKLISKNYSKTIKEKMGRVPGLAAKRAENSSLFSDDIEGWKTFYEEKAHKGTWLKHFEASAVRETVGKLLGEIVTDAP
jgi:hypothetical protein